MGSRFSSAELEKKEEEEEVSNQISLILFGSSCADVVIMQVDAYWNWNGLVCLVESLLEELQRCLEQRADSIAAKCVAGPCR